MAPPPSHAIGVPLRARLGTPRRQVRRAPHKMHSEAPPTQSPFERPGATTSAPGNAQASPTRATRSLTHRRLRAALVKRLSAPPSPPTAARARPTACSRPPRALAQHTRVVERRKRPPQRLTCRSRSSCLEAGSGALVRAHQHRSAAQGCLRGPTARVTAQPQQHARVGRGAVRSRPLRPPGRSHACCWRVSGAGRVACPRDRR